MAEFNSLERHFARLLGRFPLVKSLAKYTYARLVYLVNRKSYRSRSIIEPECLSVGGGASFFGYYDKSPTNAAGLTLLHGIDIDTAKVPTSDDAVRVAVLSERDEPLFEVSTRAYNWQQGSRTQWLNDDLFIFNDFDQEGERYIARVCSASSRREIKRFPFAVQDAYGEEFFIALDYRRLMALRPDYGYRNLSPMNDDELGAIEQDGLWQVDFNTSVSVLLVTIAQACKIQPLQEFRGARHLFNHVMVSPSGKKCIFIHRYFIGRRRIDRLLMADTKTGELQLLVDYGMVSHCFWSSEDEILGYLRGPGGVDGYWLINVRSGTLKQLGTRKINNYGDGHPHVHGDWFVTDTYPDRARMQHLTLCNWKTGDMQEIGEFFHGFKYSGECRCDLHPRFSHDGKSVFFDSVFSGRRQLYRMKLPE
jgi:hypothetical protein